MELQILYEQGIFRIAGNFTGNNTQKVRIRFNALLDQYEEVVVCLERVTRIDKKAIAVLQEICSKATRRGKILFVLGKKNKQIAKIFRQTQTTNIFRDDY